MGSDIYPKDFFTRDKKIDPKLCFILSPFKEKYDEVKEAVNNIVRECDFEPVRADDIRQPGIIHNDIWNHIQKAAVIIADVTEYNPNVFFELGVVSTIKDKSRLIIIRQKNSKEEYPFDIGPFRYILYENSIGGARKLAEDLKSFLKAINREDDAVWDILNKMRQWEEYDHDYDYLLHRHDLKSLKRIPWVDQIGKDLAAYALASSMLYTCDCKFWTDLNRCNVNVAEVLSDLVCGAYRRPCFKSAYAIQYLDESVRFDCLRTIKEKAKSPGINIKLNDLIKSIETHTVKDFVKEESGKTIEPNVSLDLLSIFERWALL